MGKKRTIAIGLVGMAIGLLVGALATIIYSGGSTAAAVQMVSLEWRADAERRALQAYYDEQPEIGIWALENLLSLLKEQAELFPEHSWIRKEIALDRARLALLYRRVGREADAKTSTAEAIAMGREFKLDSEQKMLSFIELQEKAYRSKSRQ